MKKNKLILGIILALAGILCALVAVAIILPGDPSPTSPPDALQSTPGSGETDPTSSNPTSASSSATTPTATSPATMPTEPPITKVSTATIGVTGDILFHDRVIASGYDSASGTFNYDKIYTFWSAYINGVDYAVANLEGTLIQKPGTDGLLGYNGYPRFNAPDAEAEALKNAGFDMVLTVNNHSYDSSHDGFIRTQEVVRDLGLEWTGTRLNEEDLNYIVKEINGIKIGMINYSYGTYDKNNCAALNGITLSAEDTKLANVFSYNQLDAFYEKLSGEIAEMEEAGAEAIVLYIHWGDEYQTTQSNTQKKMAQELCNLGVDVIVGNHPHVPQPVELLTSENDETQKTLCLYSTGNAVSNIYPASTNSFPKNTEDGMFFTFTFAKYSDGTVLIEGADILPTWVDRIDERDWSYNFYVLPLDDTVSDWQTAMDLTDSTLTECINSYDRTMGIVGAGLEEANAYYAQHQAEVEALLGVTAE